ncbi:hypothetical protein [Paramicrobacterium chengjingii]|uniref:hypothetical protein n=1 Tax=Paramicrobacterium chengjingii TaxID=2769067 RepID=UPI0014236873|nr:hypothetical protein [Microbacterium chengjingii]
MFDGHERTDEARQCSVGSATGSAGTDADQHPPHSSRRLVLGAAWSFEVIEAAAESDVARVTSRSGRTSSNTVSAA